MDLSPSRPKPSSPVEFLDEISLLLARKRASYLGVEVNTDREPSTFVEYLGKGEVLYAFNRYIATPSSLEEFMREYCLDDIVSTISDLYLSSVHAKQVRLYWFLQKTDSSDFSLMRQQI